MNCLLWGLRVCSLGQERLVGARNGLSSACNAKTCYRELDLLQVGQEKTFPHDQESIAQGNTSFSSEL